MSYYHITYPSGVVYCNRCANGLLVCDCKTLKPWEFSLKPASAPDVGSAPKGCICPPGSEKTCQRKDCGRK